MVAHVFYLADAKELLRAGIDGFAHGIRDLEVDEEIMTLFKQRPQVFVIPNLPDTPPSIADLAWLSETLPPRAIRRVEEDRRRIAATAATVRGAGTQSRSFRQPVCVSRSAPTPAWARRTGIRRTRSSPIWSPPA